jgi:hypothetical protein
MYIVMAISAVIGLGLTAALCVIIRNIAFSNAGLPVTAEWIDELSVERYRPMLRLLDGKYLESLRMQPGFTPTRETELRRQRCQIFEGYLRSLSTDFRRVCAAIKVVMLHSKSDRPDLAAALIHHQLIFGLSFLRVEVALQLYRWSLCDVDASSLLRVFDVTRGELRSLVPSTALLA